jgi:hypothetical protein
MKRITCTPAEYHRDLKFDPKKLPDLANAGHVSASVLCNARDPLHFLFGGERKETASMRWGNLVDMLWLTPELFDTTYIVLPEDAPQRPTKAMLEAKKPGEESLARQAWWKRFEEMSAGLTPVKGAVMKEAQMAVSMLNQHKTALYIRESSETQVALAGPNPLGFPGLAKCLIDLRPHSGRFHGSVVDLKSTYDTTDRALTNTIWRFEYHLKEAWYAILMEAAGLGPIDRHLHVWQRSSFPYDVHVRELAIQDIMVGVSLINRRLREMQVMNVLDVANLFDEDIKTLGLQEWQRQQAPGVIEDEDEPIED